MRWFEVQPGRHSSMLPLIQGRDLNHFCAQTTVDVYDEILCKLVSGKKNLACGYFNLAGVQTSRAAVVEIDAQHVRVNGVFVFHSKKHLLHLRYDLL